MTNEEIEKKLEEEKKPENLTPRQWWLYRLLKAMSEKDTKLSIKQIIEYQEKYNDAGKLTFEDLYQFKETEGNHSNCPAIYDDCHAINECDRIDKVVCFKNNQFYIGTERENIEYHNKLMHNVCRDSHKAAIIREKISQDGQMKLFTYDFVEVEKSKGRDYHEAFIKNESMIKEIERLKEKIKELQDDKEQLIQPYKNEAKMWKERCDYWRGVANNGR